MGVCKQPLDGSHDTSRFLIGFSLGLPPYIFPPIDALSQYLETMGRTLGKRDIEHVDLTASDDAHTPAQKANRAEGQPAFNGQRLGEGTQFVPLSQSSQSFGQEEDDEQAADLIQGSQDVDDSVYSTYMLYGMPRHKNGKKLAVLTRTM